MHTLTSRTHILKSLLKKLRQYYEDELRALRGVNGEFAAEFPAQAGHLGLGGGISDDPHIERFIQATALSNARTAKLIDDNDAKVTEALLNVNYPHYLRPFPSNAIVCVDLQKGIEAMTATAIIPRGATLSATVADGPVCMFRTVFDLALSPLVRSRVALQMFFDLPAALRQGKDSATVLSIDIDCMAANTGFAQLGLGALRVFIDAEQALCAATRDALFMRATTAYLALDDGRWIALKDTPIREVGFAPDQPLVPYDALSHQAYRLLTEYFVCPEKFNFFDIDWAVLAPHLAPTCRRLTLHLALAGVPPDSHVARALGQLSHKNFVLGCTPVVNLFKHAARPIELTHSAPDYELIPDGRPADAYDIHSVDKVTTLHEGRRDHALIEFRPYYGLRHGEAGGRQGRYYVVRRDPIKALSEPGHESRIALVDLDLDPLAIPDASVSIELTCTNRDVPSRLRQGTAVLALEQAPGGHPLRFLRHPSRQYRFAAEDHWRLISHLALSHCSLAPDGVERLKETLTLYDLRQSPVSQRQIAGITGLSRRSARARLRVDGYNDLVHGLALSITLDEDAYAGTGIHLFVSVLDHFFALYVHMHSFTQLTILSHASGKELFKCPPRSGAVNLV